MTGARVWEQRARSRYVVAKWLRGELMNKSDTLTDKPPRRTCLVKERSCRSAPDRSRHLQERS